MATMDDMLTAVKNAVIAINNLTQTWLQYTNGGIGEYTTSATSDLNLLFTGSGTLVKMSVITEGSSVGTIYDSASISSTGASLSLTSIPQTIGVYSLGINFSTGLVIAPGTDQLVTVTYSVR